MRAVLFLWVKTNRVMLTNTASLVCTSLITSALGFMYWWLAARLFSPEAVGLASAAISAMALLATISLLGFGSLLIGELPRRPGKERPLISTAMLLVGGAGGLAGIVFAMFAPLVSKDLQSLRASPGGVALFASGVSLAAVTFVLDQALIGLLRGGLQLWRNALFAATKLVALLAVGLYLANRVGLTIYATWALGNLLSLIALFGYALVKGRWSLKACLPQWGLLSRLRFAALQHHILNLTIMAPERVVLCLLYTGKFCVHCSVCAHNRALCHERCGTCQNRPADPPDVESFNRDQYSGKLRVVFWRQADPEPVWSRLCPAGCVEPAYPGTQCVSGDHQGPLYSYLPYS